MDRFNKNLKLEFKKEHLELQLAEVNELLRSNNNKILIKSIKDKYKKLKLELSLKHYNEQNIE